MTADNHEMYVHAPVALVTVEIRFPGEPGAPVPPAVQLAFRQALGAGWVTEPVQSQVLTVNVGGATAAPTMAAPPGAITRLTVRDRTTAVALTAGSATVETTQYGNWLQFRSILEKTVIAAGDLLQPEGVLRVGMRYVDEVRVDTVNGGADWAEWLSPAVLPPAATAMIDAGRPPVAWTGAAQYEIGEDRFVVLRYGPQPAQPGFAVSPDGPLRRLGPRPTGPFFLLDFDAFWQPSAIPEWDSGHLLEVCDQLRQPVRALFNEIITERLVTEVFNAQEDAVHD